jgi:hypothetical protein
VRKNVPKGSEHCFRLLSPYNLASKILTNNGISNIAFQNSLSEVLAFQICSTQNERHYEEHIMSSFLAVSSTVYFSTEYRNSGQNIIIRFCKYLVDVWRKAWLSLFGNIYKSKIVCSVHEQY